MRTDALFATEHGEKDRAAAAAEHERLGQLFARNERMAHGGDFDANQRLRATLRTSKKADAAATAAGAARGIDMPLLPVAVEDAEKSELVIFQQPRDAVQQRQALKRMRLAHGGMFDAAHTGPAEASSTSSAAAAPSPSLREHAIQRAIDTGIDVRALAPIPDAPAALYSARGGSAALLPQTRLPLILTGAATQEPSSAKKKRKRQASVAAAPADTSAVPAPAATSAADVGDNGGGLLGLSNYDSD